MARGARKIHMWKFTIQMDLLRGQLASQQDQVVGSGNLVADGLHVVRLDSSICYGLKDGTPPQYLTKRKAVNGRDIK